MALSIGSRVTVAWVDGNLPAGFPPPASDFAVKRHDLNELLITHLAATFMWRISGQSMIELGIFDGDIVVVNRALLPASTATSWWQKLMATSRSSSSGVRAWCNYGPLTPRIQRSCSATAKP